MIIVLSILSRGLGWRSGAQRRGGGVLLLYSCLISRPLGWGSVYLDPSSSRLVFWVYVRFR
jgi:hypothetical protein